MHDPGGISHNSAGSRLHPGHVCELSSMHSGAKGCGGDLILITAVRASLKPNHRIQLLLPSTPGSGERVGEKLQQY